MTEKDEADRQARECNKWLNVSEPTALQPALDRLAEFAKAEERENFNRDMEALRKFNSDSKPTPWPE